MGGFGLFMGFVDNNKKGGVINQCCPLIKFVKLMPY